MDRQKGGATGEKPAPQQTSASTLEDRVRSLEIKIEFLETKLNDIEDQIQGELEAPE